MAEAPRPDDGVPPAGEAVHLPGPSYLPALTAFGVTLSLVGIVVLWVITVIGVVITVIAVARWIRETREDISELPLGH
ncbi:MAG TPA: hypothetical protein VKB17_09645 [Thermoleophilaceae bacterium]|nr:hypothetical protein [Thermoleophilaceae bacterium]